MKLIERPQYLNCLLRNKNLPLIKVITGVRGSGKSTLFTLYKDYLTTHGVPVERIISINFEDLAFEDLQEYHALYRYITERLSPKRKNYIFLDEIQNVPQFEKVINSLFTKDNIDLYITGSNAHFLSDDLPTLFAGRYVEMQMLPLSFREFLSGLSEPMPIEAAYEAYTLFCCRNTAPKWSSLGREYKIKIYRKLQ